MLAPKRAKFSDLLATTVTLAIENEPRESATIDGAKAEPDTANAALSPIGIVSRLMETSGIEPPTPSLQIAAKTPKKTTFLPRNKATLPKFAAFASRRTESPLFAEKRGIGRDKTVGYRFIPGRRNGERRG